MDPCLDLGVREAVDPCLDQVHEEVDPCLGRLVQGVVDPYLGHEEEDPYPVCLGDPGVFDLQKEASVDW